MHALLRPRIHSIDAARLAWGALLVARPESVLRATGGDAGRGALLTARLLGTRHLLQGAALAALAVAPPEPLRDPSRRGLVRRSGAVVDAVHGLVAFCAAVVGGPVRATLLGDGVAAAALSAGTWWSASNERNWHG